MLNCTPALLPRAIHMLDEGTMANLFTSEQLCAIQELAIAAVPGPGEPSERMLHHGVTELERRSVAALARRAPWPGGRGVWMSYRGFSGGGCRSRDGGSLGRSSQGLHDMS
jgi:hypothetical protein